MANSIIIPLDGSTLAEQALPLGVSLAQQMDSTLQLVQIIPKANYAFNYLSTPDGNMMPIDIIETYRANAQGYLNQMKTQLLKAGIAVETS